MKCRIILLILMTSLILCLSMCGTPAYAADKTLAVNAVWLDGDMLKIDMTDINGVNSSLALRLSDYVTDSTNSEYISIQAVDLAGNQSSVVQIKNPYYVPTSESTDKTDEIPTITVEIMPTEQSTAAGSNGENPFTPDGSGTVMDNAHDGDGKEFFTVKTEDGNVFYLIVDRQRSSDNVYLLNAVSENDLMSFAEKNGKAMPTTESVTQIQTTTSAPEPQIEDKSNSMNPGTIIFIIIAVVGVGGAAYYFKIYKGRTKSSDNDSDDEESDDRMEESDEREYDDYNDEGGDVDA